MVAVRAAGNLARTFNTLYLTASRRGGRLVIRSDEIRPQPAVYTAGRACVGYRDA